MDTARDEQAIRRVVQTWMEASTAGDTQTVLGLMADDVVFMVPGSPPFGKERFAEAARGMKNMQIDGTNEIVELKVLGDWAYLRAQIKIAMTLPDGRQMRRAGYTLTILRRESDGQWRLARDANLMVAET